MTMPAIAPPVMFDGGGEGVPLGLLLIEDEDEDEDVTLDIDAMLASDAERSKIEAQVETTALSVAANLTWNGGAWMTNRPLTVRVSVL